MVYCLEALTLRARAPSSRRAAACRLSSEGGTWSVLRNLRSSPIRLHQRPLGRPEGLLYVRAACDSQHTLPNVTDRSLREEFRSASCATSPRSYRDIPAPTACPRRATRPQSHDRHRETRRWRRVGAPGCVSVWRIIVTLCSTGTSSSLSPKMKREGTVSVRNATLGS
jgi:hypothetical protein